MSHCVEHVRIIEFLHAVCNEEQAFTDGVGFFLVFSVLIGVYFELSELHCLTLRLREN